MVEIGRYNSLEVVKLVDFGIYVDGGDRGEILVPSRFVPSGTEVGNLLELFIYHDSEGRLIGTTQRATAQVGEFAVLQVKQTTSKGAFLDWGLMKELLVPFKEQRTPLREGQRVLVYLYLDVLTERVVATTKVERYLADEPATYERNAEVEVIIAAHTPIGFSCLVEEQHMGMLYHNELYTTLQLGERRKSYVKGVREDGKIDLSLRPVGYHQSTDAEQRILQMLAEGDGFLALHDKSDPYEIQQALGCSKKQFKQIIGSLYRQRKITLAPDGIRLA